MKFKWYKLFYILAILLVIIFVISQIRAYYIYPTILTAITFQTMVLISAVGYAIPTLLCVLIGYILQRRDRKK